MSFNSIQIHLYQEKINTFIFQALLLLINLVQYNVENRSYIMNVKSTIESATLYKLGKSAILALTELFYQREQLARYLTVNKFIHY